LRAGFRVNRRLLKRVPFPRTLYVVLVVILILAPTIVYYVFIDTLDHITTSRLFVFELMNDVQGSLYFAAMGIAAITLLWRGFVVTWLAAFLIHLPRTIRFSLTTESLIHNLGFWFLPLSIGALITLERYWRATQRRIEQERQQEREVYIQKTLAAQEEERRRIAKELHDETIQDLVALAYVADAMFKACLHVDGDGRLTSKASSIKETSLRVVRELRRISSDLRPSTLDHLGLVPSLRTLAERTGDEAGISTRLTIDGVPQRLDKQAETAIFRIVQEGLANVRKHSGATEAWVSLDFRPDMLRLTIGDNGQGFNSRVRRDRLASEGHLGLLGIRERATALGGSLQVQSRRPTGTKLNLKIPIPTPKAELKLDSVPTR